MLNPTFLQPCVPTSSKDGPSTVDVNSMDMRRVMTAFMCALRSWPYCDTVSIFWTLLLVLPVIPKSECQGWLRRVYGEGLFAEGFSPD